MGDGLLLITVGLAVAFSGVIALISSFLSGFIIYRVNPQSAIGESLTLGVVSGVMLIILLIPAWFAFIIFWGSVGGNSLVLVVSLVFGTVVCLSIAKIRSLLLY